MSTQVLLLRGINVGGRHSVPMAALRELLSSLGCREIRTYIQSGNAVVEGPGDDLGPRLEAALLARFGFAVPVIVRSAQDLRRLAQAHPLQVPGALDKHLYVGFLSQEPDPARVAALDPLRSPPDCFVVQGAEVFAHYPGGSARSRLTADWFDRCLGLTSTWRNQATVRALAALVG